MFQETEGKEDQSANSCDRQPNNDIVCAFGIRFPRQFYFWQSSSAYNAFLQRGPLASSSNTYTSRFSNLVRWQLPSAKQQVSRVTSASGPSRGHSLSSASSAITPTAATSTTLVQSTGILSLADLIS